MRLLILALLVLAGGISGEQGMELRRRGVYPRDQGMNGWKQDAHPPTQGIKRLDEGYHGKHGSPQVRVLKRFCYEVPLDKEEERRMKIQGGNKPPFPAPFGGGRGEPGPSQPYPPPQPPTRPPPPYPFPPPDKKEEKRAKIPGGNKPPFPAPVGDRGRPRPFIPYPPPQPPSPPTRPYPPYPNTKKPRPSPPPSITRPPTTPHSRKTVFPTSPLPGSLTSSSSAAIPRPPPVISDKRELHDALKSMRNSKWPDRAVPFVFDPTFSKHRISEVLKGMETISRLTCIRFNDMTGRIPIDDNKRHKVVIRGTHSGCFATLGYNDFLKTSYINLDLGCFPPSGKTIMHELAHTLGIIHTQCRFDRDNYIDIDFNEILQGRTDQFDKRKGALGELTLMGLPYDYNSIMHYPTTAFSKKPDHITMKLKKKFNGEVGFPKRLSRVDVATLNRLYDCNDHYLGDDIPGSMSYKQWRETFMM